MTSLDIKSFAPGYYYYISRYARHFERSIHLLKYWGTHVLVIFLLSRYSFPNTPREVVVILLAWASFQNIYDMFCMENDTFAADNELNPTIRTIELNASIRSFVSIKSSSSALILLVLFFITESPSYELLLALHLVMSVLFFTHNRLSPHIRPITLTGLYICKTLLILSVSFKSIAAPSAILFIAYSVLFSLSYIPQYCLIKYFKISREDQSAENIGQIKHLLTLPFFYKTVSLIILSFTNYCFLIILGWVWVLTLLEYALLKYDKTNRL